MSGCVSPDPDALAPIEPLPPAERLAIRVEPVSNDAPSRAAAELAPATSRMLVRLLERSRRFAPVSDDPGGAAYALRVSIADLREEDRSDSVIYRGEQVARPRRLAVVELAWERRSPGGGVIDRGSAVGTDLAIGVPSLNLPSDKELQSGAFWNTPYGRATKRALDRIVETLVERGG